VFVAIYVNYSAWL